MKYASPPQVKIAVTLDDGTVAIMSFVTRSASPTLPYGAVWEDQTLGLWTRPANDANVFAEMTKAFATRLAKPVSYVVVEEQSIPVDRTYRNALRHTGSEFAYDLEHAKGLHLALLRQARVGALEQLDREWMKAAGQKDQATADAVEAQRQVLRDLPQSVEIKAATTINELKASWPVELAPL